jgi:hypothetical protein
MMIGYNICLETKMQNVERRPIIKEIIKDKYMIWRVDVILLGFYTP